MDPLKDPLAFLGLVDLNENTNNFDRLEFTGAHMPLCTAVT